MRTTGRALLVIALALAILGILVAPDAPALTPEAPDGSSSGSLSVNSLLPPAADQLLAGEGSRASRAARRNNPRAVAERSSSRTQFEGLTAARAVADVNGAFPALDQPSGDVPELAPGQRVVRYPTDHAAELSLPGGGKGLLESSVPIAGTTTRGAHEPFDLRLASVGGGRFETVRSDVGVVASSALSHGVELPQIGVSLTPVDRRDKPLTASPGKTDGGAVQWSARNTGPAAPHDLVTLAKASPEGFDLSTLLFSERSPNQLYFRVDMPAGAQLRKTPDGSIEIVNGQQTIAVVAPVSAEDAEGTSVPVSVGVSGNVISVHVDTNGDYLYPIAVDPEVNDSQLAKTSTGKRSGWEFHTNSAHFSSGEANGGPGAELLESKASGGYGPSEYGFWGYQTKGVSHIYELKTETSAHNNGAKVESFLEFEEPSGAQETKKILSTPFENPEYEHKATTICAANASKAEECLPGSGKANNAVHFQQSTTGSSGTGFSDSMTQGIVSIAEPAGTHSTTGYNTTSPTLEFEVEVEGKKEKVKRGNALYGSGSWLTASAGALALNSSDPGIGVAQTKLEYESSAGKWTGLFEHNYLGVENACQGVQCYVSHTEDATLPIGLPDGEDTLRYRAEEAISGTQSLESEGQTKVKVDTKAPHNLQIQGLPFGNELSERAYELTAEATDGEGTTLPSSGVQSIALLIDGHEVGAPTGSCTVAKGQCTATRKVSVNGAELGAGKHDIEIISRDTAGNEAHAYQPITIKHSTPVALGPGSIDLQSGDFALGATDVSLGDGLTVARNYSSRDTNSENEGPFGPQWSMNLGTAESLSEVIDGAMMLTDANGRQVLFAKTATSTYESPTGDSNLVLKLEENKTTKEKLAFYLEDPTAHTKTKFTLPSGGGTLWVPSVQEGAVGADTVGYKYQTVDQINEYPITAHSLTDEQIAVGKEGNLWFAERPEGSSTGKIGRITPAGVVTDFALPESGHPLAGLTVDTAGNVWTSTPETMIKMTPTGTVTTYPKKAGTGATSNLAAGAEGNVWYTEKEHAAVGKITPSGTITEYALPAGSAPSGITLGPDGNLWFANNNPARIGRVTPAGAITEFSLSPGGEEARNLTSGPEGDVWFTAGSIAKGTNRVGKITMSGVITEYAMAGRGYLEGITSGPDGHLWVTDSDEGKVLKVTTAGVVAGEYSPNGHVWAGIVTGPDGRIWFPTGIASEPGRIDSMTPTGTVTEPVEVWSAASSGASCESAVTQGCRVLQFTYASGTTATGEAEGQWADYKGRLSGVRFEAYDPTAKAIQSHWLADYSYDSRGRLRSEYDLRISPALKTRYAYDEEGHVTALSPPGQEPWIFSYGSIAGDSGTGRLLKAYRVPASTAIAKNETVANTKVPTISGSAVTGATLSVTRGTWSGSPVGYSYRWSRCTTGVCTSIPGANNPMYTVATADLGDTLMATVQATNADGSTSASSVQTATVLSPGSALTEYAVPAGSHPFGITAGPDGNVWFTDASSGKAGKITPAGAISEYATDKDEPVGITAGPDGNLWFVEHSVRNVAHMTTAGALTVKTLTRTSTYNVGIASGPDGDLWFTESETGYIGRITTGDVVAGEYALPTGSKPYGITKGPDGNLWFTDYGTGKIGKITTAGTITEYTLPAGSKPYAIAAGPDGNLWFTDSGTSKIGKITTGGTITEYALPASSTPYGITKGADGNVWFADSGTSKIGKITTSGVITETALPAGSQPYQITTGAEGNIWFTEYGTSKLGKLAPNLTNGESVAPEPGTTINYGVPLSGTGAPAQMTSAEVAKWGQKDDPVEATSITAPDEPQGWPASSYKRATTYYLDSQGRQVNVASPSSSPYGSVSTTEYNEFNDPIRSLTPENRQTALEAGAASVERSKLLDTQNTYNGEGAKEGEVEEPGTRLIESVGPQHKVTYVAGHEQKESLARLHSKLFYDEGAPGGETYDLQTKKSTLAQLSNEEEVEVRTTKTSYSGQSNLGWKLRAPTSIASYGPEEAVLTKSTTEYNPTTGQVTETRGTSAETTLSYAKKFGEAGTEPGKLKTPWGTAVNAEGALLVVDSANNRIEKFSSEGTYVSSFGTSGSGNGQLKEPQGIALDSVGNIWVADTGNNRIEEFSSTGTFLKTVGSLGTESGKLKAPAALAFDPKGNLWVADTANNRIEKFNKEGIYGSEFGSAGSEPGKLQEPKGIAIDSSEHVWVADTNNNRIEEFSQTGSLLKRFATKGSGEGQLNTPIDLKIDAAGDVWTADSKNNRAEAFTPNGGYVTQAGSSGTGNGQLAEPKGIAFDATGKAWVADSNNNRMEQWSKGLNAHDQKTVYYSTAANSEYPSCGGHAEYAGLTCETLPAKQPELAGLPALPTATYAAYNIYDEPETITEAFGSSTRTEKETYDAGGRRSTSETTASSGKALPKVTFTYSSTLGVLEKESAEEKTLSSEFNLLGQLVKYTDADGNSAKYSYAGPGNDYLLTEASDSSSSGTSRQSYEYDPTTKLRTKLIDSAAGSFTATYDTEGQLTSESYPYGVCAAYSYNSVGEATNLSYKKSSNCAEAEPGIYYSDSSSRSIRGELLRQESTLANDTYTYDPLGRLTETQETPAGEGCTVRAYSYDEESNRATSTTRAPGTGGACQAEGGSTEGHNYDEGNRLTDPGIAYDPYGNVTKLPAADAEGHELTSSYYVDNAVATQTQSGITNEYKLDPEGRTRELVSGSTKTIDHYDGPGETIAWSESSEKQLRNIAGIDGTLLATQTNGETPVLQLHDLQGDVVATIGDKAGETKLLSSYAGSEFGVPKAGKAPPKLAFLGALGAESSFSSGVITYGATSYVPQIAQALQSEAVNAPGLPGGSGAGAPYTMQEEAWNMQGAAREAAEAPGLEAAREQAAREAAELAAREAEEAEEAEAWEDPMEGEVGQGSGGGGKKASGNRKAMARLADSCNSLYCKPLAPSQNVPCKPCEKKREKEEARKAKEEHRRKEKERWEEAVECGRVASYRPGDHSPAVTGGLYYGGGRQSDAGCVGDPGPDFEPPCELFGCGSSTLGAWRPQQGQEPRREPEGGGVVPAQDARRVWLV
jgi:streptogramin lyase